MNFDPNAQNSLLANFFAALQNIDDPRDPRGVRYNFHGVLALVFLGLLARIPYMAQIERWS